MNDSTLFTWLLGHLRYSVTCLRILFTSAATIRGAMRGMVSFRSSRIREIKKEMNSTLYPDKSL